MVVQQRVWFVTLASGTETAGAPLSEHPAGAGAPVQFCRLPGGDSPLDAGIERARRLGTDARHVLFLRPAHDAFWNAEKLTIGPKIVYESEHRGSGASVLAALSHLVQIDAAATLVVQPAHLAVEHEQPLEAALLRAVRRANLGDNRLILLSLADDGPRGGWTPPILDDRHPADTPWPLGPQPITDGPVPARVLRRDSGFVVGRASAFVRAFDRAARRLLYQFLAAARSRPGHVPDPCDVVPPGVEALDLARHVLPCTPGLLRFQTVRACGALDLRDQAEVLGRLRRAQASAGEPRRRPHFPAVQHAPVTRVGGGSR